MHNNEGFSFTTLESTVRNTYFSGDDASFVGAFTHLPLRDLALQRKERRGEDSAFPFPIRKRMLTCTHSCEMLPDSHVAVLPTLS